MMNVLTRKIFRGALGALGLLAFASLAWAQNSLERLDVSRQGEQVLVRVALKNPLATAPGTFTVANPARIAFDFPATVNNLGRNSQDIGEGELRSMNVAQAGDRTRLVLNLRNMVAYEAKVDGNNLLITLTQLSAAAQAGGGAGTRFAEGTTDTRHAVKDISFRRGRNGEGRLVVDLSDTATGVDIRQQGQSIIVDFIKTSLPEALR
jgi:type IV pilus assembly protein PilQ